GELCGVPFHDARRAELRAARADAVALGDQMRRAWEDLVAAECRTGPLLLVLEDLHWGDLPTVRFVDAALRALADQPLVLRPLAGPGVQGLSPDLWRGRGLQVIRLRRRTARAMRTLIHETLGADAAEPVVQRIIEGAAGNAFFGEELIRAAARGETAPG